MGKKKVFNKNNSKMIETEVLNDLTYQMYEDIFKSIAMSQFEWVNLPSSMDERFLEETLFYNGQASLLESDTLGYINSACVSNGNLNNYGLPTALNCYSYGFSSNRKLYTGLKNEEAKKDSCILVLNNQLKLDTFSQMQIFAYKMYNVSRIIDINVTAMKTPIIFYGDEKSLLALKNLYAKYDGNEPVCFVNKNSMQGKDILSLDTKTPFVADKLEDTKKNIFNEALTFLGINNISIEKKERLVSEEASSNNELINYMLNCRLIPRQKACKQFNELFGTNISVRLRSDLGNIIKKEMSIVSDFSTNQTKEGED